jgi:nucleoside-diphosphate-sugar epimerase
MRNILMTGITGFIGSFFARELLKSQDVNLYALVRPKSNSLSEERIDEMFHHSDHINVLEGDLTEKTLGLPKMLEDRLALEIDEIWNFAGVTSFDESRKSEIIQTNVEGTKNVIEFAKKCQNLSFLGHISTAYVCGDRKGVFHERELSVGQNFHNTYEESKFTSEMLVRESNLPSIIFRPSVVVGDSVTGETTSFNMVYIPWSGIELAKRKYLKENNIQDENARMHMPMRIYGDPNTTLNIIPIDSAVNMLNLLGKRENVGKTFHVTNPKDTTMEDLREAICKALNIEGVVYCPNLISENGLNAIERLYLRRTKQYHCYMMNDDPKFDMTNSTEYGFKIPAPTPQLMERLIRYGISRNWGK